MKMRYILLLLLAAVLLTACRKQEPIQTTAPEKIQTEPVETVPATETQPVTEPVQTTQTIPPTEETLPEPEDTDFVKVADYIPTVHQQLFYATEENFTGHRIYDFSEAYLRYGTVKKLMAVSRDLEELGLYIKIWDGFRPVSAQFRLWEIYPNPTYVANPTKGYSSHSRGNTIDLTLVDGQGVELEMPTDFDDFSAKADRDYSDCTEAARSNAQLLELLMEKHGFTGYWGEWWHFSDTTGYPVEENFEP